MTKKRSSEILADEKSRNFSGKGKIFDRVRKFFENRGNLKQGGKCIVASGGMDAPGWAGITTVCDSTVVVTVAASYITQKTATAKGSAEIAAAKEAQQILRARDAIHLCACRR